MINKYGYLWQNSARKQGTRNLEHETGFYCLT